MPSASSSSCSLGCTGLAEPAALPPSRFIQPSSTTHSPGHGQGGDKSLQGQGRALAFPRGPLLEGTEARPS